MKKYIVAILISFFIIKMSAQTKNWARIDSIVKDGIAAKAFPGCQVIVWKDGKSVYDKCFGKYTYTGKQRVGPNTMYDLASLSKTTGTLLAIMKLYDQGKINLDAKVSNYLPFLRGTNKDAITIKELLFHESGLPATLYFYKLTIEPKNDKITARKSKRQIKHKANVNFTSYTRPSITYNKDWVSSSPSDEYPYQVADFIYVNRKFHDAAMQMIVDAPLKKKSYLYSCVNFILLKEVVETISGVSMDIFLDKSYYLPMNLKYTAYLPLRKHAKSEIAPTVENDLLRGKILQGYVHDESAAFLGGISGNAGLFSSAKDVATIYQMLLNGGEWAGKRYLKRETCQLFTATTSASGRRKLGFDKSLPLDPSNSPCCEAAPTEVYGHTGFTGTCCWVDPINRLVYVFLSNRVYPNPSNSKLSKMRIRSKIQSVIYQNKF